MRPRVTTLGLGALAAAQLGCLVWPFPTGELLSGRGRITREYVAPLKVGVSTRADVLLHLGEPDQVRQEGRILVYRWNEMRGFLVLGGYGGGALIPFPGHRSLQLVFDAEGRLAQVEPIREGTEEPEGAT